MGEIVVIIVYNRLANLQHWFDCWQQCNLPYQLVVIHNSDGETYQVPDGVIYIKRKNIGFDIGAFQDVCYDRLPGFPKWEKLLWITDDTVPMRQDFVSPFFKDLTGVRCMQISAYVRPHIRTTGFAITKDVAARLTFPADPVLTKEDCYQFEHRSKDNTFKVQIEKMGLKVVQVAPDVSSPLFDMGYGRRLRHREKEHYKLFPKEKGIPHEIPQSSQKVVFLCPIYQNYPQIVSSLLCQTYQNWELILVHDGPGKVELPNDKRIKYFETKERAGNWGHSIRSEWLQNIVGDYVVITNPDNYHTPNYIEAMLKGFKPGIVAVYCSHMVHSYINWKIIATSLRRGFLDCAGVMLKLDNAKKVGWSNVTDHSADWFFFSDMISEYGAKSFYKIEGCLLIHN